MLEFIKNNKITVLLGVLLLVLLLVESGGTGDFDIFLSASKDLLDGKNIYTIKYHEWYHYYYDVLFALILFPLQFIPIYWATFIWLLANVFFTFRIWKIILSYLPIPALSSKQQQWHTILSFAFIFTLWHKNIHLSQMTIFILYLSLEGIYQIQQKRLLAGSVLIGIGISIKIMPIVLIPYFLYRGNFKAAIYIVASLIIVLWLPVIFIGYDYHVFLLQERWLSINPANQEHVLDVGERSFHSLTNLLSTLLVEKTGDGFTLDLPRNFANVSMEQLNIIINVVRLAFISFTLYFLRSFPFKKSESSLLTLYEVSYILLVIPLIFPHQQHYAFFMTFPAISYLVFFYLLKYRDSNLLHKKHTKTGIIILGVVIYFLLNSHFILGQFRDIYNHYKTLTYGVLILIPLLAFASPNKVEHLTVDEITPEKRRKG